MSIPDFVASETPEEATAHIRRIRESGGDRFQACYRRKDKTMIDVEVTAQHVATFGKRFLLFVRDITESKLAQQHVADALAYSRTIIESSPIGMVTCNSAGQVVSANANIVKAIGGTIEQVLSQNVFELGSWQRSGMAEAAKRALSTRTHQKLETKVLSSFGKLLSFACDFVPIEHHGEQLLLAMITDITERKLAEEKLKEGNNLLRTLIDNLPENTYVYIKDAKRRYVINNAAHLRSLGVLTQEDAVGKVSENFFPSDLAAQFLADEQEVIRSGRPLVDREECLVDVVSGEPRWHLTTKIPLRDSSGQIVGIAGMSMDITKQKQSAEALQQSEEKFRMIFEKGQFGLTIADSQFRFVAANPAFCQMIGYSSEELSKLTFADITPSNRLQIDKENVDAIARGEKAHYSTEKQYLRKDGQLFWGSLITTPVRDSEGNVTYYLAMVQDISEKKQVEEALRESETRLEKAQTMAHVGNWEIDLHTREMWGSEEAFRIYGVERGSGYLPLQDVQQFALPEDRARLNASLRDIIVNGKDYDEEFQIRRQIDGLMRYLHSRGELVLDPSGKPGKVTGVIQDITERKRGELLQDALRQISQAADEVSTLSDLFKSVHETVSRVMPAKNFYISLYDSETDLVSFPYFVDEVDTVPPATKARKGLTEYVLRTGQPLFCDEPTSAELERLGEAEVLGAPSAVWLGVPLKVENTTIGVMVIQHYTDPKAYGIRELQMLEYVSTQVARAIERKRAEQALQESERSYRTTFENTGTAAALVEENTVISLVNQEFEHLSGYSKREIEGKKSWTEFVAKEDLERMVERLLTRLKSRNGTALKQDQFRFVTRTGELRDILLTIDLIPGTKRSVASLLDITDRKRMEEALRSSEEKFKNAFHFTPVAMSIQGSDDRFIDVNNAFMELTGYAREEIVGSVPSRLQLWARPHERIQAQEAFQKDGYLRDHKFTVHRKSGQLRSALMWAVPVELNGVICALSAGSSISQHESKPRRRGRSWRGSCFRHSAWNQSAPWQPESPMISIISSVLSWEVHRSSL